MSNLILILDDELNYAKMLSELLLDHGYATDVCTEPHQALERLQENSYGLIISDFKMPDCDGAEFITQLRRVLPHIPVIVISGLMGKPDLLKIANIGVELVLEKPFNVPTFLEFVARYIERQEGGMSSPSAMEFESAMAPSNDDTANDSGESYPKPLRFLADKSPLSVSFLNQFWSKVSRSLHTLVIVPPGGEISLMAQEVAAWLGLPNHAPLHLTYGSLEQADVREQLQRLARSETSSVVVLTVPTGMEIDHDERDAFLRWTLKEPGFREQLHFIHALPDVVDVRRLEVSSDLAEFVSDVIALPPLSERLVDLAVYSQSILGSLPGGRANSLTEEAVKLLLNHPWKRNYAELLGCLHRASAYSGRGRITEAALASAIKDQHNQAPDKESTRLGLEHFLYFQQRSFLRSKLPGSSSIDALRELIGERVDRIQPDLPAQDQPFLFHELTTAD